MDNLQLEFPEFDPITFNDGYEENGQHMVEVCHITFKFYIFD
jgi:hypothetical protein